MSILSLLPVVGDAVGKSAKYIGKSSPKMAKFLAKHGPKISQHWPTALAAIKKSKQMEPYAKQLDDTVRTYLGYQQQQQQRQRLLQPTTAQQQVQPQTVDAKNVTI
jgi:hypothetical protein